MSPSGFAASVIASEGLFHSDRLHEGMVLYHDTKFDMSLISLEKLSKTKIVFPVDADEMLHCI